jgi:hypothetical protein
MMIDVLLVLKGPKGRGFLGSRGFGPVSSVRSSRNCPTLAEDNEQACFGWPTIGPFWGRGLKTPRFYG